MTHQDDTKPHLPKELVREVSGETGLTQEAIRAALDATLRHILLNAEAGKPTVIRGFGTFKPDHRKAGERKVPGSDRVVAVPARHGVKFTPSKAVNFLNKQ